MINAVANLAESQNVVGVQQVCDDGSELGWEFLNHALHNGELPRALVSSECGDSDAAGGAAGSTSNRARSRT